MPGTTRLPTFVGLALAALVLAGCDILQDVVRGPDAPSYARLEVWNATTAPLFLVDREGRRLDVPACARAVADVFEQQRVEVRTDAGYVMGFGSPGGETQYIILVARASDLYHSEIPPVAIPPCEGKPEVQPGV